MANHICIVLHGIECNPSDTLWSEELAWRLSVQTEGRIKFYPRKYGYVSGSSVWWNWGFKRDRVVNHELEYFNRLRIDAGPNTKISVIAHSLGGYIIHRLMHEGMNFHRIIELYGAGNENENWSKVESRFDKFFVWYSPNDEVLPKSNFGQIGLVGPKVAHPRVFPIETTDGHTTFMEDAAMYANLPIWRAELED